MAGDVFVVVAWVQVRILEREVFLIVFFSSPSVVKSPLSLLFRLTEVSIAWDFSAG